MTPRMIMRLPTTAQVTNTWLNPVWASVPGVAVGPIVGPAVLGHAVLGVWLGIGLTGRPATLGVPAGMPLGQP